MNEKEIAGLLIGVVYPAMIAATAWGFIFLLNLSEKQRKHSSKSFDHRVGK